VNTNKAIPIPRIPASARKAGAKKFQRTGPRSFNLSFAIVEREDGSVAYSDPGNGPEIVEALKSSMPEANIHWNGAQADAINVQL
jgi:hypothetical protein